MDDDVATHHPPTLRQCARCRSWFPAESSEPGPTSTTWTCAPCSADLSASNLDGHP